MESLNNIGFVEAAVISWSCGEVKGGEEVDGGLIAEERQARPKVAVETTAKRKGMSRRYYALVRV
jgi:hypothetical protein